jgi:catechol 2,3-dioxygenase-like lactoylglutathione lyase family enzyme
MGAQTEVLIAVRDVPACSAWYQQILGCKSDLDPGRPDREEFDRIVDEAGRTLISFHAQNSDPETPLEEHLSGSAMLPNGRGVIIGFAVDDLEAAVRRASALGARLLGRSGGSAEGQFLRDPDGYVIHLFGQAAKA